MSNPRLDAPSVGLAAVTGSSRGLGFHIAYHLAEQGYDLILINRYSEILVSAAKRIEQETGRRVQIAVADLLDEEACIAAVKDKPVDVLVNCGIYQGSGLNSRIDQTTRQEIRDTFQANVLTQISMVQTVLPGMIKRKKGRIFQLVSGSSRIKPTRAIDKGGFQSLTYSASKAAIAKMIPLLALEYSEYPNMMFFNVDPGLVITDKMRAEGTARKFEKWGVVPPEQTARVVGYLCTSPSHQVKEMNGAEFVDAPGLFKRVFGQANL